MMSKLFAKLSPRSIDNIDVFQTGWYERKSLEFLRRASPSTFPFMTIVHTFHDDVEVVIVGFGLTMFIAVL